MPENLLKVLHDLMNLPTETEWVEFKEAGTTFDFEQIGRYVSALSNEANLNDKPEGWLIFGVTDKPPRKIVGSHFNETPPGLDKLKHKISLQTNHQLTFLSIHDLNLPEGRVVMFKVPPATRGIPTEWKGSVYGRIHDSTGQLALHKIQRIRDQSATLDWSAHICEKATIANLDPAAIAFARQEYKKKNPHLVNDVDSWTDAEFLNRAGLCIDGRITNTAILLLGKNTSGHHLSPAIGQITWVLKNASGVERDYAHFGLPIILAIDNVFEKIRNLTVRHISDETLFPLELTQYDSWVMRELLHNCIAHQDYLQGARISVVENVESLLFTNRGMFIPGSVDSLFTSDALPDRYRNPFLAQAMVNLNMIDTVGSGIKRMFRLQRERNFPLPDYNLSQAGKVSVRITGKIIDPRYTRMLVRRKDLDMPDVIALDKVQKGQRLSEPEFASLKSKKLVEGRRPNLYVSETVASETDTKVEYIRKRSFDRRHFKDMVIEYLKKFKETDRKTIEDLLIDKVSDALNETQKRQYIKDLLQEMRKAGTIRTKGSRTFRAKWILTQKSDTGSR
ncbi:MAG: putative DNA binding domain-containing protein [Methanoregula sp.]|nr:putative DNA binding domain-containing protein [Methanoregula sp.]